MGRQQEKIEVTLSLSNHNSEQDEIDRAAAERLRQQIRELVKADPDLGADADVW